jgi:hypothetical protein
VQIRQNVVDLPKQRTGKLLAVSAARRCIVSPFAPKANTKLESLWRVGRVFGEIGEFVSLLEKPSL